MAAAHAYAKATGTVAFAAVHNLVGLMHASMAVYDAWCDRTPIVVLGGGGPSDPQARRPIDWFHSANPQADLVRPYVKWDAEPVTARATIEAIRRAHWIAGSAPTGPAYVTIDTALQEAAVPDLDLPPNTARPLRVSLHPHDVEAAVVALCEADFPVIVAGGVGLSPGSSELLVELMELLGAAGRDERNLTAIPTGHPLCFSGDDTVLADADLVLAVDVHDIRWVLARAGATPQVIELSTRSLAVRSWPNADHVMASGVSHLVSDPLHGLSELIAGVERFIEGVGDAHATDRARRVAALYERKQALDERRERDVAEHWEDRPVSVPRMVSEVYRAVEDLPWLLTLRNTRSWPEGIWQFDRAGRYLGHSGGGGMGYGPGALIGGGLAARDRGEFAVGIIGDGDLMFAPGALWTAAHHRIPMLVVVNNNRSYLNDEHHQAQVARMRGRPVERSHIGTVLTEPSIDFAALGRSLGAWAEGPIDDPAALEGVLARSVEIVQEGGIAVVDIHTGK